MRIKLNLIVGFLLLSSLGNTTPSYHVYLKSNATDSVYICNSTTAKRYHSTKNCNGLRNCTHEVNAITKQEAESKGRTPCKICYK